MNRSVIFASGAVELVTVGHHVSCADRESADCWCPRQQGWRAVGGRAGTARSDRILAEACRGDQLVSLRAEVGHLIPVGVAV